MGGMRGAGFSALLGLDDFRKDALATALHVYYINRKYPHAELSLSCPRLRPIVNNEKINPRDVGEKELCQVLCAYRIFLPFVGITVSSRESAEQLHRAIRSCLTEQEREVVVLRYGLNGKPPKRQREVAIITGISRSYVSHRGYCKR